MERGNKKQTKKVIKMKTSNAPYRIADLVNGAFSEDFDTLEDAEVALAEEIEIGQAINDENAEEGFDTPNASEFFFIVDKNNEIV